MDVPGGNTESRNNPRVRMLAAITTNLLYKSRFLVQYVVTVPIRKIVKICWFRFGHFAILRPGFPSPFSSSSALLVTAWNSAKKIRSKFILLILKGWTFTTHIFFDRHFFVKCSHLFLLFGSWGFNSRRAVPSVCGSLPAVGFGRVARVLWMRRYDQ